MIEGTYCRKCGKEFFPTPYHRFVEGYKKWCSWTCFNHRHEGEIKKRRTKVVLMFSLDGKFIREFESAEAAAVYVGASKETIFKACREEKRSKGYLWKYRK